MSEEIMSADEVAEYLSMSRSSVYKMVQHREIPFARVGSMLRFPKGIIDKWLRENTTHPHRSLLEEFELLIERFHLKKFLRAKGIEYEELGDEQLVEQLKRAVEELRATERGAEES